MTNDLVRQLFDVWAGGMTRPFAWPWPVWVLIWLIVVALLLWPELRATKRDNRRDLKRITPESGGPLPEELLDDRWIDDEADRAQHLAQVQDPTSEAWDDEAYTLSPDDERFLTLVEWGLGESDRGWSEAA
jgi:hypothetical protein